MPTMRAVQVSGPGGEFELVRREIPDPGAGEVLIKVEACGVCHGDAIVRHLRCQPFSAGFPPGGRGSAAAHVGLKR